jgi:hypothetical protein
MSNIRLESLLGRRCGVAAHRFRSDTTLTHDARKRLKRGLEAAGFTAEDIRAAFAW